MRRRRLRRAWRQFLAIPHLFAKMVIWYCVGYMSYVVFYAMRGAFQTGILVTDIVALAAGLFGGELLLLCLKTVIGTASSKKKEAAAENKEEAIKRDC